VQCSNDLLSIRKIRIVVALGFLFQEYSIFHIGVVNPIMQCEILYFARLRETFGKAHEAVALPAAVTSVDSLLDWLRLRGEPWSSELAAGKMFRIAVNQEMANGSTALADGCEIAIFPPVTGG